MGKLDGQLISGRRGCSPEQDCGHSRGQSIRQKQSLARPARHRLSQRQQSHNVPGCKGLENGATDFDIQWRTFGSGSARAMSPDTRLDILLGDVWPYDVARDGYESAI